MNNCDDDHVVKDGQENKHQWHIRMVPSPIDRQTDGRTSGQTSWHFSSKEYNAFNSITDKKHKSKTD